MGAGASSADGSSSLTEREEKFFQEMQNAYENEYKPKMNSENKMERNESLNFFKLRVNSFVDSEKSEPKTETEGNAVTNANASKGSEAKVSGVVDTDAQCLEKSEEKRVPARAAILRTSSSMHPPPAFYIGDIVKAKVDGMMFEGVVVENGGEEETVEVDFGDDVETVKIEDCAMVMSGLDFEVGDFVQARTTDSVMYCHGKVLNINLDGTFDIIFDGDDEEDVERNIPHEYVRKHRTGRSLARKRWQRVRTLVSSVRAFGGGPAVGPVSPQPSSIRTAEENDVNIAEEDAEDDQ
jgi:hypothetical protein